MASVGAIKIPLQATLDPKGFDDAKARMRDLSQTGAGSGGGGGGGIGGAAGQLGRGIGGMVGGPMADIANLVFNPGMGMVAGGLAAVGITQKFAANARDIRMESMRLGTTTKFYQDLSYVARKSATDMGSVTTAIEHLQSKAQSALGGDKGAEAFFKSIGLDREDLKRGMDDVDYLTRRTFANIKGVAQSREAFGRGGAEIIPLMQGINAGQGHPFAMTAGELKASHEAKLALGNIGDAGAKGFGWYMNYAKAQRDMASEGNWTGAMDQGQLNERVAHQEKEARQLERLQNRGKYADAMREAGQGQLMGLMTPGETEARTNEVRSGYIYSDDPGEQQMYARRSAMQAKATHYGAISDASSNTENLTHQLELQVGAWRNSAGSPSNAEDKNLAERRMGMSLTGYAEGITNSGALSGAYGNDTVAGYSQQVGSEYAMSQSQATEEMIKHLLKIAENTGVMSNVIATGVMDQLGFRTADPIFGGK